MYVCVLCWCSMYMGKSFQFTQIQRVDENQKKNTKQKVCCRLIYAAGVKCGIWAPSPAANFSENGERNLCGSNEIDQLVGGWWMRVVETFGWGRGGTPSRVLQGWLCCGKSIDCGAVTRPKPSKTETMKHTLYIHSPTPLRICEPYKTSNCATMMLDKGLYMHTNCHTYFSGGGGEGWIYIYHLNCGRLYPAAVCKSWQIDDGIWRLFLCWTEWLCAEQRRSSVCKSFSRTPSDTGTTTCFRNVVPVQVV